jgi:branched-chain amino acid transport system ATP-binding protein
MSTLLQVEDVAVHFGGVKALDGVTLGVESGSLCGLIGPNGSGKSTMLGVISRLTHLTSGRLVIDGEEYTHVPPYMATVRGVSRTFQTVRLLQSMTVLGNVMIGASSRAVQRSAVTNWLFFPRARTDNRAAREAAERALDRVGMIKFANAHPLDLPYGHQRHVEIARALASEPKVLLLDEPCAGMNYGEREEVGDLLLELNRDGLTQVLVEHDLALIHRLCNHTFVLNFGRVIAEGTPAEVSQDETVREAYLGHGADGQRVAQSTEAAPR